MKHVAILGNGIAGITAARHIRKNSDFRITVISSETEYFFSRTALMYVYMHHMPYDMLKPYEDWFWRKNKIDVVHDHVDKIDFSEKYLELRSGPPIHYDYLVLATGSKPNKFGWPGEELKGVMGMYSLQDLKAIEHFSSTTDRAVIVGGGLIGIELAEMLRSRHINVTMLIREDTYWGNVLPPDESAIVNNLIREHEIDLRLSTELKEICPDTSGRVRSVHTHSGEEIKCQMVGLTAGVSPNIDFLKETELETDRGILVNKYLKTNLRNVYAIGDCAQHKEPPPKRKNIEQIWYTARTMGETVAQTITGIKTPYTPGIWFNSAKFFDIEFQNYGWVFPQPAENEDWFYWEHESGNKCLRIVFHKTTKAFHGINCLGIRYDHNIMDKWLREKVNVSYVIENLHQANFDPEFYPKHEQEIRNKFLKEKQEVI